MSRPPGDQKLAASIMRDAKRMSYSLVGQKHGLTKNQVAGIIWRAKNPPSTRIYYISQNGWHAAKCGRGRGGVVTYPAMTLMNTR